MPFTNKANALILGFDEKITLSVAQSHNYQIEIVGNLQLSD
jgi:hypothetical protein